MIARHDVFVVLDWLILPDGGSGLCDGGEPPSHGFQWADMPTCEGDGIREMQRDDGYGNFVQRSPGLGYGLDLLHLWFAARVCAGHGAGPFMRVSACRAVDDEV